MTMKTLKYILLFLLNVSLFNSCLIDNATDIDLNDKGPNLAGFEQTRTTFAAIADGEEYKFDLKVKVAGPTWQEVTNGVTLTVSVDPSSTAIQGKHFKLSNPTITLLPGNNMLGLLTFTMLTKGIQTPLDVSPVVVLKVTQVSGDSKVINSGKPISITLSYACPSFLDGNYNVTTIYTATTGAVSTLKWTDVIKKTGIGEYRTSMVGHWSQAALGGTPGFTFSDVCGQLSVPEQNLVDLYSNLVTGTAFGKADPVTGNLYIEYSVCASGACRYYKSTYVKQ